MARPEVGEVAEQVYAELRPFALDDEANDWHLLLFVDAICESLFEAIHLLVADREDLPGWSPLLDPDLCPAPLLPYLGQYVGVTLEPSLSETEQRDKIRLPENFKRGTLAAMVQAIKRTLSGDRSVFVDERYTGDAYELRVRTLAYETADAAVTEAAVRSQKPAGLKLTYQSVTGQLWSDLIAERADWTAVLGAYATWDDVVADPP